MKKQYGNRGKLVIGLTGSFGSGKTTVAGILKSYGALVIDADKLARGCLVPGSASYKRIVRVFGKKVLMPGGAVDRKKLADAAFKDAQSLIKLNSIIHPIVIRAIKNKISSSKCPVVVLDAPLLIEAGLTGLVDKLVVVSISRQEQLRRLKTRTRLSKQDILKRIKSQIPLARKVRVADFVIDNSATIDETKKQTQQLRRKVWKN